MNPEQLPTLIRELASLPGETEWVEFKVNNGTPEDIGEYLSAIANSAALHGKARGYIVWGVEDKGHALVGTAFRPRQVKVGNEELENWLVMHLTPRIDFRIHQFQVDGRDYVIIKVPRASHTPVRFKCVEYVRSGTYKKKLKDFPEKERSLWAGFARQPFEKGVAVENASSDQVLALLDYPSYFEMTHQSLPDNRSGILQRLGSDGLVVHRAGDLFDITNLGAVLFAKNLNTFDTLARKAIRVVLYKGANRVETVREQPGHRGYAVGFEGAIQFINTLLPQNEAVGQALRTEVRMYPEIAVRELVANALIHQDFSLTGTGPMVEIFSDRIEITNPGVPLIDTLRFIDEPPRSRNEVLAALMRRMNICEERGSGIDKVVSQAELFQLPAPDFRQTACHTVVVMFGPRTFSEMEREDRIRACYQHACLLYVSGQRMTNSTLRKRLGIKDTNYPIASRIIRDTLDANLIKQHASGSGSKKDASYFPFWG
jgi:predicted HTH transcriptional regulator